MMNPISNTLSHLRSLVDAVRGMGLGDPDSADRILASDVVRWAADEIDRLRLTDEERKALAWAALWFGNKAEEKGSKDDMFDRLTKSADTLRGLLERLG